MEFKLHPLVLLNVSDHYTRSVLEVRVRRWSLRHNRLKVAMAASHSFKAQLSGHEPPRVLGCLLGLHLDSRTLEICNSFEIKYDGLADNVPQIDSAFLTQKQEQCARPDVAT